LSGFFRGRDVPVMLEDLELALDDLEPGFDVIVDLSHFKPASPATARFIREGAEIIKRRGRRNAVRITGRIVSGVLQFKRILEGVFPDETVSYAKNMEEAEAILDRLTAEAKPQGARSATGTVGRGTAG